MIEKIKNWFQGLKQQYKLLVIFGLIIFCFWIVSSLT